jgi:gamma-glutamylcyclotransferase
MIYFAYGSNLCERRFLDRVKAARFLCVGKSAGYRVVFHKRSNDGSGKATLVAGEAQEVFGALYEIDVEAHRRLRTAEGWPKHYVEQSVKVETSAGLLPAITYVAAKEFYDPAQIPYRWYLDLIRLGGRKLGLPLEALKSLEAAQSKSDPDAERSKKEEAWEKLDGNFNRSVRMVGVNAHSPSALPKKL